ncbi:hypothetical protein [Nannocystis pusilla]|uniref:hypothetical protein n=1 Tax=Nannocystis pusilla TaxID=889268 RepID=UPI003B8373E5
MRSPRPAPLWSGAATTRASSARRPAPTSRPRRSSICPRSCSSPPASVTASRSPRTARWSFGLNNAGQLGRDGDSLPAVVPGLEDIVAIAAGGTYSLAVDGTGAVWAWGNTDGQLGDGMTVDSPVPKAISMIDAVAVAAGKAHTSPSLRWAAWPPAASTSPASSATA